MFVPDEDTKNFGRALSHEIRSKWNPPPYYVHLSSQGHVRALRQQSTDTYFARLDLKSFFGSIKKNRITRNLNALLSDHVAARQAAVMSTVPDPMAESGYVLPFGFVQSPLIASLCLSTSKLGRALAELDGSIRKLVYVDDILISTSSPIEALELAYNALRDAATASGFVINEEKSRPPASNSVVFNIEISQESIALTQERLTKFAETICATSNANAVRSIVSYVASVSAEQAALLPG